MLNKKVTKKTVRFEILFKYIIVFFLFVNMLNIYFKILPPSKGYIGNKLINAINKLE